MCFPPRERISANVLNSHGPHEYLLAKPRDPCVRSLRQVSEIAGVLQGLEWVVLAESRNWGIDSTTIDLAYGVRTYETSQIET